MIVYPAIGYLELQKEKDVMLNCELNSDSLLKLANYRMPFGKYANRLLVDIPEPYFIWFSNKGFPEGELGQFMTMMLEIKVNGLEYLLEPLKSEK